MKHSTAALLALTLLTTAAPAQDRNVRNHIVYPPAAFVEKGGVVIDITKPPYNAKGDGRTDDTQAFIDAFEQVQDRNEKKLPGVFIYVPKGTYLVSDTLARKTRYNLPSDLNYRLIGEDRTTTTIKLKDNLPAFAAGAGKAVVSCNPSNKGNGGMMWGHQLRNLTIDTGKGNPGACGVIWRGANATAIDNVTIRSGDGSGDIGLDFREWCVQGHFCDITVEGFDHGIRSQSGEETNPTIEYVTLKGQKKSGVFVDKSNPCFRKIESLNSVPAFEIGGAGSQTVILDSRLASGAAPALVFKDSAKAQLFLRNIKVATTGPALTVDGKPTLKGDVGEWLSGKAFTFDPKTAAKTLNLPIAEAVIVPWESDPAKWASPDEYPGSDFEKVQAALNSGKPAVCFPRKLEMKPNDPQPKIPASVRQIDFLNLPHRFPNGLSVAEPSATPLWIENPDDRPVIGINAKRDLNARMGTMGCRILTNEKVTAHFQGISRFSGSHAPRFCPPNATIYARSINEENWSDKAEPNFLVNGGSMWVMGFKTEAQNTAFHAINGASLEVLGGYVNFAGKTERQNPDLINEDSSVSYIGTNFMARTHWQGIQEIRDGITKSFGNKAFPRRNNKFGDNYFVPLYVGLKGAKFGESRLRLPEGTRITASFATDPGKGPEVLFDGDKATWLVGGGGTGTREDQVTSIFLKFPKPVSGISAVSTGSSDRFHNYYPMAMEFWADTTGDGKSDTKLGFTDKLGPDAESIGTHPFERPSGPVHTFELRVTKQHVGGGKRAWTMNEIVLHLADQ